MATKLIHLFVILLYITTIFVALIFHKQLLFGDCGNKTTQNLSEERNIKQNEHLSPPCSPGRNSSCIPPFRNFPSKYRISTRYSLAACVVEKSMSTLLAAIMCLLHDPQAFQAANRTLHTELYYKRFCKNINELTTFAKVKNVVKNGTFLAVVRDPLERFLSGYTDKCIKEGKTNPSRCYGCGRNLTCFITKQYRRMKEYSEGRLRGISFEDVHFSPQSWHCNFRDSFNQYAIIRYGGSGPENDRMIKEMDGIWRDAKVEKELRDKIREEISASKTSHATADSTERVEYEKQLRSNRFLMEKILQMFYYDYVLFGFELPNLAQF